MRVAPTIMLNEEEHTKLTRLAKSRTTSVRLARRAQVVLLAAMGKHNEAIAQELKIGRLQVGRWRERYAQGGLAAIERDRPRGGRPRKADAAEIVRLTTRAPSPRTPLTGARAPWRPRWASATQRYCACGAPMDSSRTGSRPSRSRAIRGLSRNWRISWACI